MPSKPLFGSPVAVGISAAVMAIRSVVSASARGLPNNPAASASMVPALRISMISPVRRSTFDERKRANSGPAACGISGIRWTQGRSRRRLFLFEQLAIFLDVAGHELLKHIRRMLIGVRRNRRELCETLLHHVGLNCCPRRSVQSCDDLGRR